MYLEVSLIPRPTCQVLFPLSHWVHSSKLATHKLHQLEVPTGIFSLSLNVWSVLEVVVTKFLLAR